MPDGAFMPDGLANRERLFHDELEQLVRDEYLTVEKKLAAIEKLVGHYFVLKGGAGDGEPVD